MLNFHLFSFYINHPAARMFPLTSLLLASGRVLIDRRSSCLRTTQVRPPSETIYHTSQTSNSLTSQIAPRGDSAAIERGQQRLANPFNSIAARPGFAKQHEAHVARRLKVPGQQCGLCSPAGSNSSSILFDSLHVHSVLHFASLTSCVRSPPDAFIHLSFSRQKGAS